MKIITIGRGENSHILIDNPMVSRQHALLKIKDNGKMTIVDKSSNGTSINGSRIKPDRETPVSRRDVVTFAGVSQLDWKEVPDPLKIYKIIGLVLAGLALALGIFLGIKALIPEKEPVFDPAPLPAPVPGPGTGTGSGDSGNTGSSTSNDRAKQIDIDGLLEDANIGNSNTGSSSVRDRKKEDANKKAEEARKLEEEAKRKAEEAAKLAEEAKRQAEEAKRVKEATVDPTL